MDTTSKWGRRSVQLSKSPQLLAGFSLQHRISFDGVIRTQVAFALSREHRSARVGIPALLPGINFFAANYPYYSIVLALGIVPDLFYNELAEKYTPVNEYPGKVEAETPWCASRDRSQSVLINLDIPQIVPDNYCSMMLSIGIKYGINRNGGIEQVPKIGCGKVLTLEAAQATY